MRQWLKTVHQKPLAYRKNMAFLGAFLVTTIIAGVWLVSLPERFAVLAGASPTVIERDPALTNLFRGVREQVGAVRAAVNEITNPPATTTNTSSDTSTSVDTSIPQWAVVASSSTSASTTRKRQARPILIATTSTSVE